MFDTNLRRRVILAVGAGALAAPLSSFAQQGAKIAQIGFLGVGSAPDWASQVEALRAGLRDLGYVEGKNVAIEYRWAEGKSERLRELAAELVRLKMDVLVTHTTPGSLAAKRATTTIPIVITTVGDPVGVGLAASLGRPGGNITGLSNLDTGLAAKRLELLKEVLPKLARVAVLRNPTNASSVLQFTETQAAARSLGMELQLADVRDPKELEGAFSAIAKASSGALSVLADAIFISRQKQIADFAMTSRLPSVFARNENVEAGGLMSYGSTLVDQFRQAATYVDKILKGAKPAELPIEQPTRYELVINLKTARALGLAIPQSVLIRADRVIE